MSFSKFLKNLIVNTSISNHSLLNARSIISLILLTSVLAFIKNAHAENEQLKSMMLANNCTACHLIDRAQYAPQFKDVAAKYSGDSAVISTLATKIRKGGKGVWGDDMMPPQTQVSEADARTIVELILAIKPNN